MSNSAKQVGDTLGPVNLPAISPVQVAFMVVANNDTAAIHVDEAAARKAGLPATVAPGSFVLGHAGRLLETWAGFAAIRSLDMRFRLPVFTGDALMVGATIRSIDRSSSPALAVVDLWVRNANADTVATGDAQVAMQQENAR
jgi:acyl dehydratase